MKLSVLSFLLTIPLMTVSCSLIQRDGIYLIPEGYKGGVIILFDQPDGIETETANGLFVYPVSADGVLKVKTAGRSGIVNKSYYYVDTNGGRTKIETLRITGDRSVEGLPQNKFGNITQDEHDNTVFIMSTGGLGSFNTAKGTIQFTSFIVGTPKDSDSYYRKTEDKLFGIQKELVERHRRP